MRIACAAQSPGEGDAHAIEHLESRGAKQDIAAHMNDLWVGVKKGDKWRPKGKVDHPHQHHVAEGQEEGFVDALDRQLNPALADIASDQSGKCLGQPKPRHKRDRHVLDGNVARG